MKVAVIQMDSRDDATSNLSNARENILAAVNNGSDLILLPETVDYIDALYDSSVADDFREIFSTMAKANHVYIHGGSIHYYKNIHSKPYNTTFMYDRNGNEIASYDKVHMFDVNIVNGPKSNESDMYMPGNKITTAETEFGRIGFGICYDIRFPLMFQKMALTEVSMICIAANFTEKTGEVHWKPLLQALAIQNECYVLASNQCGSKKTFDAYGHSMIIDPWGKVLEEADNEEVILYADIDFEYVWQVRRQIPVFLNRCEAIE